MFRKVLNSLFFLALCTICAVGQEKEAVKRQYGPDLSGTWKLDPAQGNYAKLSGLKPDADLFLVIAQVGPEIKVTRKSIWQGQETLHEAVYYADGRGEVSRTMVRETEHKSKTVWKDGRLRSTIVVPQTSPRAGPLTILQVWRLSADGMTLTQTQETSAVMIDIPGYVVPPGTSRPSSPGVKRVFRKIS